MFLGFPLHFVYYIVHLFIRRPQAAADSASVSFVLSHKSTPKQEEILSNPYKIFVVIPLTPPKSENRARYSRITTKPFYISQRFLSA